MACFGHFSWLYILQTKLSGAERYALKDLVSPQGNYSVSLKALSDIESFSVSLSSY